ncbi:MAG TPA: PAS domain-containing protein [Streptosporangiaceae bacterium]|nr:PAS domain-containing protein [Streptosporangiaceae bacterium]
MIPGGSGYSVDIAAISGIPGLAVVLVDEDQKILSWNEAAADLFGVPAAQMVGQPAADIAGQQRTVTGLGRESLAPVIAAEGGWSGSRFYQRQDGSEFLIQATGLRVPLECGTGTLWIAHLPGKDSDQQALGEALALAAAERRRLTMIAEAGKLFGSSLDLDVVLDLVVTKTAQALGDCCQIRLLDESGEFLLLTATHHNDALRAQTFQDSVHGRPAPVMPEMLGHEVARRVHAIRPALPVLYMSGYAQPILDTHGALAGQIDLLEKPFTEATLLTRVRRAIDNGNHSASRSSQV